MLPARFAAQLPDAAAHNPAVGCARFRLARTDRVGLTRLMALEYRGVLAWIKADYCLGSTRIIALDQRELSAWINANYRVR
jgi:hypothetical protein